MKFRELLQTELWSKETSRKILEPTRRILFWIIPSRKNLVRIGIVLGVLVVVLGAVFAVELSWLTSGERKAATVAMVQINALQDFDSISMDDANTRCKQTWEAVRTSEHVSWTLRDHHVAFFLSDYLWMTEQDWKEKREIEEAIRNNPSYWNSHPRLLEKLKKYGNPELRSVFRTELQKELK
jgi:hypothetical protein